MKADADMAALTALFDHVHRSYARETCGRANGQSGITHDHLPFEWSVSLADGQVGAVRFIHDLAATQSVAQSGPALQDFMPLPTAFRELGRMVDGLDRRPAFQGNFTRWIGAGVGASGRQLKIYLNPWAYYETLSAATVGVLGATLTPATLTAAKALMDHFADAWPSMIGWNVDDGGEAHAKIYFRVPQTSVEAIAAFLHARESAAMGFLRQAVDAKWRGEAHFYIDAGNLPGPPSWKVNLNVVSADRCWLRPEFSTVLATLPQIETTLAVTASDFPRGSHEVTYVASNGRKHDIYFKPKSADGDRVQSNHP
ncbi:hypothetical protein [Aurantimonas marianensis]|uniref:Uncharacterized protein n=1 Tax=Aurantimonas marianensis TaxID=2920428 RepID=A0A9X2HB49_9HYPH|nr:hypothetical protein [Aurantimonas marianensis]MCP3055172.1 hypothetical protein [Aurantimonas marianensis]